MGIEERGVLQSKHLQDLFSDANSESAFYVCIFFFANKCLQDFRIVNLIFFLISMGIILISSQ